MNKIILISILLLLSSIQISNASERLLLLRANSKTVDIRDGAYLRIAYWNISPEIKPDLYTSSSHKVTFITDLDSISFNLTSENETKDFIILLNGKDSAFTRLKYSMPYLEKLKRAEKYNLSDNRIVPAFSYQSSQYPGLVKVRQELRLDSIAGKGNEISRILNLMHWVHSTVRHDGNSKNPKLRNAIDLINVCRTERRGVNCRMMATILNECYLSMGIKSRYITCLPRETEFDDCHVINMVYSNDLHKWIYIDPTFDAYVMNEKGELLGIAEVRERLINGKTLILNPEANWNRTESQTKEYYLETYMAKNLYRLECPVKSEYDSETYTNYDGKKVIFLELLPLDGLVQTPDSDTHLITNNPDIFWTKPE
jgi:transglutaminase-like putative cysteine protease